MKSLFQAESLFHEQHDAGIEEALHGIDPKREINGSPVFEQRKRKGTIQPEILSHKPVTAGCAHGSDTRIILYIVFTLPRNC